MKKVILLLILILSMGCVYAQGLNQSFDSENDNIYLYSTWDEDYFYVACEAQCPNVKGKSQQFNAPIGDDDGIEIVVDLSHSLSKSITSSCFSFAASVMGGFEFKKGNKQGVLVKENIFSHKITANVIGSINNDTDIDSGYVIEFAIPWNLVTDMVPENQTISFSYRVRISGKDYYLTNAKEFYNPSSWYDLMMTSYTSSFATRVQNRLTCGKYLSKAPVIDGVIKKGEWNAKTRSNIKVPVDQNLYKLAFKTQKIIVKDLILGEGKSIIDDTNREDVIRKAILDLEPVDCISVPVNEKLPNVLETVRIISNENNKLVPIIPIINVENTNEFISKLKEYIFVVPNQFRFITSDNNADRVLYVKSNSKNLDFEAINNAFSNFKVSVDKNNFINNRIVSEYAYIITNYSAPTSLQLENPEQFNFIIKNVGSQTWKPLDMAVSYRWYKNDRFYTQGFAPIPITKEVKPGASISLSTSLMPVNYMNKPIESGDVVIEIEPVKSNSEKLITSQSLMLKTTVTDTKVDDGIKIVSVDMNKKQELGKAYSIILDVKNSSAKAFEKGDNLYATLAQVDSQGNIIKEFDKERVLLYCLEDTPIGMIGKFVGEIKFTQGKKPEDIKNVESEKFAVVVSQKKDKVFEPVYLEVIEFVKNDYNQKLLLASEFPSEIKTNNKYDIKIVVRNAGNITWKSGAKIIANWYNKDGKITDNGGYAQISKKKIKPGNISVLDMTVISPERPGEYNLVCGIYANGEYLSNVDADRSNNLIIIPVVVKDE